MNIGDMLAAQNATNHTVNDDDDATSIDVAALEREERLTRVMLRRLEWENIGETPTIGGPGHQVGVGAPLQQINTRAHGRISQKIPELEVSQKPDRSEVQAVKLEKEMNIFGGPCHQYGGGAPPQQINTRARGRTSQKNPKPKVNLKPETSTSMNMLDMKDSSQFI